MTPEQEAMLRETHEAVQAIAQVLKGYNGKKGLLEDFATCRRVSSENFEEHKQKDVEFRKEFYRFQTWVYVLVAFAAGGGGAVGAGITRWLVK